MADGPGKIERKVHPATGEVPPQFDVSGRELMICDHCGLVKVGENGLLCVVCVNQEDIRGWYENELVGRETGVQNDLDPLLGKALTPAILTRHQSHSSIIEQEQRASYPRLKDVK